MNAELLRELIDYRTSKQKSVMMASRSILQLYRIINPELLPRKERVSSNLFSFLWPTKNFNDVSYCSRADQRKPWASWQHSKHTELLMLKIIFPERKHCLQMGKRPLQTTKKTKQQLTMKAMTAGWMFLIRRMKKSILKVVTIRKW